MEQQSVIDFNVLVDTLFEFVKTFKWEEHACCHSQRYEHEMPELNSIEYIDGISVNASFLFYRNDPEDEEDKIQIYLNLTSTTGKKLYSTVFTNCMLLVYNQEQQFNTLTRENLFDDLKIIEEKISKLKYNKKLNEFVKPYTDTDYRKDLILFNGNFLNPNKNQKCCVCFKLTTSKTKCNHFICLQCFFQLQKNECPLCKHSEIEFI